MEPALAAAEDKTFNNTIGNRATSAAADHTHLSTNPVTPVTNGVIRINNGQPNGGYPGRSVGAGIVVPVAPGDIISAEVYAYYASGYNASNPMTPTSIVSSVASL